MLKVVLHAGKSKADKMLAKPGLKKEGEDKWLASKHTKTNQFNSCANDAKWEGMAGAWAKTPTGLTSS